MLFQKRFRLLLLTVIVVVLGVVAFIFGYELSVANPPSALPNETLSSLLGSQTQEELNKCFGQLEDPPIPVEAGINSDNEVAINFIIPWEKLHINRDQNLLAGPQTVVVYIGRLDYLTTELVYLCNNRQFYRHYTYKIGEIDDLVGHAISLVRGEDATCPINWDCTKEIKVQFMEDDEFGSLVIVP